MRAAVLFALVIALAGPRAFAESTDEKAKAAFHAGVDGFKAERFEEALASFKEANRLKPTWKMLYNIGQCEAALKHYGQAIEAFESYLGQGGDDVPPERRDKVLAELDRMRRMVGGVKVKAPAGTQVLIDGEERGRAPLGSDIAVTAGVEHDIRLVKDGQELLATRQSVRGGSVMEIEAPEPKAGPLPQTETKPLPQTLPESGRGDQAPEVDKGGEVAKGEASKGLSPLWFWTGLGTTGAFGAVAVGMNFAVDSRKNDIKTNGDMAEARRFQTTGIAFIGLAGAAAVTTAIVAGFTDFSVYSDEDAPKASAWAAPGGAGVAVGGRF
ncbi:MAG: tetratricopeptide repeat protein [Deltaproteobacteria bacterium]|nr:tetratricopeptide repeat protein [Deltaproteobacteria bacterium]